MLAYFSSLRQSLLFRDPLIKYGYLIGALANLASWALASWAALTRLSSAEFLALHTTVYFGIDLFGPAYRLFFYPCVGLIIIFLNAALAARWGKQDVFLARSSAAFTAGLGIVLFFACLSVVLLNI